MTTRAQKPIVLASGSEIRAKLLRDAGIEPEICPARIDEAAIRDALMAESASPHDIADTLAEMKARKVSSRFPDSLVLGCDQVLSSNGRIYEKPHSPEDAVSILSALSGATHHLHTAATVYRNGEPLWRHVAHVRMTMVTLSGSYLESYVREYWDDIRYCVGCYRLEAEGVRLFSHIDGNYFHVLGLPLIELLTWLRVRGDITT